MLIKELAGDLVKIRKTKPLIHHITNMVVMNETANATLCIGALPVMAHAREEVEEMAAYAGCLVLNIGTLYPELISSMIAAGQKANELGVPVVLDPVGAGATKLRTQSAKRILAEVDIDIVRGNAGEVSILAGHAGEVKGVESISGGDNAVEAAKALAKAVGCVTAVTGAVDVVSDGTRVIKIDNGDAMLASITGTGCTASTMTAAFRAVQDDSLKAAAGGLIALALAGEAAAESTRGRPGSFQVALYDSLALLTPEIIVQKASLELK